MKKKRFSIQDRNKFIIKKKKGKNKKLKFKKCDFVRKRERKKWLKNSNKNGNKNSKNGKRKEKRE